MTGQHRLIPPVSLSILDRAHLEDELDRAVDTAIQKAQSSPGRGILVTRHDHSTFTIEVREDVPQGTITEHDLR